LSGKKSFDLYDRGIASIKEIPDDYKLSKKQAIQKESLLSGETHLDKEAITRFLESLEYPLYYLDFETISPVVPLFDGTRPYQQIPFQYSVHIVQEAHTNSEHYSFLFKGKQDPRPSLLEELQKVLGVSGSIIAYNKGFEEGIIKDLGEASPECEDWVNQVLSRMIDLLAPFRNFDYYHPSQIRKCILKSRAASGYRAGI